MSCLCITTGFLNNGYGLYNNPIIQYKTIKNKNSVIILKHTRNNKNDISIKNNINYTLSYFDLKYIINNIYIKIKQINLSITVVIGMLPKKHIISRICNLL